MQLKTLGYLMAGHTLTTVLPFSAPRSAQPHRTDWRARWEQKARKILLQHIRDQGGTITLDRPPQYLVRLLEQLETRRRIERIQVEGLIERVANASVFTYRAL